MFHKFLSVLRICVSNVDCCTSPLVLHPTCVKIQTRFHGKLNLRVQNKQTNKQEKDRSKAKERQVIKEKHESKENKKGNATPTPKLNNAWAYLCYIFPMQPSAHWLAHVGERMVDKKDIQVNQQERNIKQ